MEGPSLPWLLLATLASCISITYKLLIHGKKNPTTKTTPSRLPPGPAGIPLRGNIFDLKGELHNALARLAGVHGPVMSLKLGTTTAIVVSSTACARDVLQTHDRLLAARSISDAARALGNHERAVIWLPSSSPLWKRLRALCARHLFSAHGLEATRAAREEKARELVGCLRARAEAHEGQAVDVGRVVLSGPLNVMSNALFSEDVADLRRPAAAAQEMEMLIKDVLEELTKPNLSDLFPALAVLDLQGRRRRRRRRAAERLTKFFDFFDPIIGRRMAGGGERKDDFLDVLLQLHSEGQMSIQTVKSFLAACVAGVCRGGDVDSSLGHWEPTPAPLQSAGRS
ncbi:hypothetical protein BRADI_4g27390v3 [Brachypodium distachyon]|uniref:Cytochrome P450 n=1 Tax=Brachypodium distachyon TaxID=15368 RepID=A0A2K2CQL3_BRADI|nr:hypothetical protein BRADI_4g27390v3 [Brachypodium distachyon]